MELLTTQSPALYLSALFLVLLFIYYFKKIVKVLLIVIGIILAVVVLRGQLPVSEQEIMISQDQKEDLELIRKFAEDHLYSADSLMKVQGMEKLFQIAHEFEEYQGFVYELIAQVIKEEKEKENPFWERLYEESEHFRMHINEM